MQSVKYKNAKFHLKPATCRVPQGSILGPLLMIYINDLGDYLNDTKLNLYADDAALYFSGKYLIDIMLTLHLELSIVDQWLKQIN